MNRIKYGISNVVVWPIASTSEEGEPTYGTRIPVPGSVNLGLDPQDNVSIFYADNVAYVRSESNSGYDGDLEIAIVPPAFEQEILGFRKDASGVVAEYANGQKKDFAMAFQFEGDVNATRHILYRVSSGRAPINASTTSETTTPDTDTIAITALPRIIDQLIKAYVEADSAKYAGWLTTPVEPTPEG